VTGDAIYLGHILEAIRRIRSYVAGGEEAFLADEKTQDAVLRNLQVIGEAAKKISADLVAGRPEIPWRSMTGLRDRVVHDYFGVSLAIVWDVVTHHLPALETDLRHLEASLEREGSADGRS
jgi:uncharacterized protein with HEPN domain